MLGKDRFKFESPNIIDAGEAPPANPHRRNNHHGLAHSSATRSAVRSSATAPEQQIHKTEHLFRGEKIDIVVVENDDHSASTVPQSLARVLEIFEDDDDDDDHAVQRHDQLPSPEDARLYAHAVMKSYSRHNNINNNNNNSHDNNFDSSDNIGEDLLALELQERKPLSSSAVAAWSRPSRRKSVADMREAAMRTHLDGTNHRHCPSRLILTIMCSALLLVTLATVMIVFITSKPPEAPHSTLNMPHSTNDGNDDAVVVVTGVEVPMTTQSARFLQTVEWLAAHSISNGNDLATQGTPQYQAALWMADVDELQLEIPVGSGVSMEQDESAHPDLTILTTSNNLTREDPTALYRIHEQYERFVQRYVLAVFYFSTSFSSRTTTTTTTTTINSAATTTTTTLPAWPRKLNFLSNKHECFWYEFQTANDHQQYAVGVTCDAKMKVQDLFIPDNNLQGTIPSELRFLQHLELLSLRHNQITGTFPQDLVHLYPSLQYLDLSKNMLSGSLPNTNVLGRLQGLKALGLMGNLLEGTLPAADLARLTQLKTLDLGYNRFQGHLQSSVYNLTNLEYLYCESNQFDDTLDNSFLVNLHNLEELTLNNNQFRSSTVLPLHLLSHPKLSLLDLSNNFINANFPTSFLPSGGSVETRLKLLNLRNNQLKGTLPLNLQELSKLEFLDVSHNALTGTVPVSLGNMKALTHIRLGSNRFVPNGIPPTLFTILNLKELSMPMTSLVGPIPAWVSLWDSLEYLDLSDNSLTGSIPNGMLDMPRLSTLNLRNNQLSLTLPASFPKSQLDILALDGNPLVRGNATDICQNADHLTTFTYGCEQVVCIGSCCHSECCSTDAIQKNHSQQCFSSLLSSSLQAQDDVEYRGYVANRTILSFSPSIIRDHHA